MRCVPVTAGLRRYYRATFALDLRSIGLFRIGLGLTTLADFLLRYPDAVGLYSNAGVYPLGHPALSLHNGLFSLDVASSTPWFPRVLLGFGIVAAIALTVGYRARLANVVVWTIVLALQYRNPLVLEGADVYQRLLLFWGNFLPLGACFSIDSRRRGRPVALTVVSAATLALTLQIGCVYLFNGINKWNPDWLSGRAVQASFRYLYFPTAFARGLLGYPPLLDALSYGTLAAELLLPPLLLIPWYRTYSRMLLVCVFFLFHAAIWLCLDVGLYSFVSVSALFALLPSPVWQTLSRLVRRVAIKAPPRPKSAPLDRSSLPLRITALVCLAYVLFHNVADAFFPGALARRPAALTAAVDVLRLKQRWSMFFRADTTIIWPVLIGRRTSGEAVTFPAATAASEDADPSAILPEFPSHRWTKYFLAIGKPEQRSEPLRRRFAAYWCDAWRPQGEQLAALEFWFIRSVVEDAPWTTPVWRERQTCPASSHAGS